MFARISNTAQAFFVGLAMLVGQSMSSRLNQHKTRLLGSSLMVAYYTVQLFQFAYHGKVAPKEHVSDVMGLLFQFALAPVFYAGFHKTVEFMCREDVQRALWAVVARVMAFCVVVRQVTLGMLRAIGRTFRFAGQKLFAASFLVGLFIGVVIVGFGHLCRRAGSALMVGSLRIAQFLRRFASQCVEAGQKTEPQVLQD